MKNFSVKAIVIVALAFVLLGATTMFADTVTYSTTGVFGSSGTAVSSSGTATLTFTGVPSTSVNAPTNISLGTITSAGGTGTFSDSFTLTIHQTAPSSGSQPVSSNVSGTVTSTSNGITLVFAPQVFTIGSVTYQLDSSYKLVAPNTNSGVTSIQAAIVTPEPASLLMLGGGILAIGGSIRRKLNLI